VIAMLLNTDRDRRVSAKVHDSQHMTQTGLWVQGLYGVGAPLFSVRDVRGDVSVRHGWKAIPVHAPNAHVEKPCM
jgi:hypothetical protein